MRRDARTILPRKVIEATPIHLAVPNDARFIAAFSRDCIECGLGWSYTPAKVLRAIASRSTNVAVMREHDRPIGFGIMDYGDSSAHLALLGVLPARRRGGRGAQLLEWLELCAVNAGIERIRVETRADNLAAGAFYRACGYEELARIDGYYRGTVDAIRLEKRLHGRA